MFNNFGWEGVMFNQFGESVDLQNVGVKRIVIKGNQVRYVHVNWLNGERLGTSPDGTGFTCFDKLGDALDWIAERL